MVYFYLSRRTRMFGSSPPGAGWQRAPARSTVPAVSVDPGSGTATEGSRVGRPPTPSYAPARSPGRSRWGHCSSPTCFPRNIPGRSGSRSRNSSKTASPLCSSGSGIFFSPVADRESAWCARRSLFWVRFFGEQFPGQPIQISGAAGHHRCGEYLRHLVGMMGADCPAEAVKEITP